MRKITLNPRIGDKSSFDFENDWIVVKDGNDLKEFKATIIKSPYKNYSMAQIEAITKVNHVLKENKQPPMDDEEIEYLLYPFGKEVKPTTEELQALSGFRVEKTIVKIGD